MPSLVGSPSKNYPASSNCRFRIDCDRSTPQPFLSRFSEITRTVAGFPGDPSDANLPSRLFNPSRNHHQQAISLGRYALGTRKSRLSDNLETEGVFPPEILIATPFHSVSSCLADPLLKFLSIPSQSSANETSFSVSPPLLWVVKLSLTVLHDILMSG